MILLLQLFLCAGKVYTLAFAEKNLSFPLSCSAGLFCPRLFWLKSTDSSKRVLVVSTNTMRGTETLTWIAREHARAGVKLMSQIRSHRRSCQKIPTGSHAPHHRVLNLLLGYPHLLLLLGS